MTQSDNIENIMCKKHGEQEQCEISGVILCKVCGDEILRFAPRSIYINKHTCNWICEINKSCL